MNRIIQIVCCVLLSSGFWACEEETSVPLSTSDPVIIVDALITSVNEPQVIFISQSHNKLNEAAEPVTGAIISLKLDGAIYHFNELTPGNYVSAAIPVTTYSTYTLLVNIDNKVDSASATMLPVSPFKNYRFIEKENGLLQYYYTGSDLPAMTEVYYSWDDNPRYCELYGACQALQTYYTLNSFDIIEVFSPDKEEVLIPENTLVVRKKYSLSAEHQDFIRSLQIETEWRGGVFDVEQGNIPTNFSNGLKGWFGVCQVISDSTFATAN